MTDHPQSYHRWKFERWWLFGGVLGLFIWLVSCFSYVNHHTNSARNFRFQSTLASGGLNFVLCRSTMSGNRIRQLQDGMAQPFDGEYWGTDAGGIQFFKFGYLEEFQPIRWIPRYRSESFIHPCSNRCPLAFCALNGTTYSESHIFIPIWMLLVPVWLIALAPHLRRRFRKMNTLCLNCGYCLRFLNSENCPECSSSVNENGPLP